MKLFFCHSSRDKALIREVRSYLPTCIKTWLDEDDILIGMNLKGTIRNAIQKDADYVVVFLGNESIKSPWVRSELNWAIEQEKKEGHVFILPVLLDNVWDKIKSIFKDRLYLTCYDMSKSAVKDFSERLSNQLFALLCQRLNNSKESHKKLNYRNITAIHSSRREMPPGVHFLNLLSRVETSLSIAGISLNFLISQSLTPVIDLLINNESVNVNVLFFNPKSKHINFVAKFANKTGHSLKNEINANIYTLYNRIFNELNESARRRINIRTYDIPPIYSLTILNKETDHGMMLLEFFQYKGDTDDRISFELASDSDIYRMYLRSFDKLWNDSSEYKSLLTEKRII